MDIKQIWNASLSYIQNDINSVVGYNTYIKDIVPISFEGEDFAVAVSTSICKTMIELRYTDVIEKSISKIVARPVKLTIILKDQFIEPKKESVPAEKSFETEKKKVTTTEK